MYSRDGIKVCGWFSKIGNPGLLLLLYLLHFIVSIWYCVRGVAHLLDSYVVISGLLKRYKSLDLGKLRYLAIVVESEEARQTCEVVKLLHWLEAVGVKSVCLYDMEGVLKESKESILEQLPNATLLELADESNKLLDENNITLEFWSLSDGREALTKAANVLYQKCAELGNFDVDQEELLFTEPKMAEALRTVGYGGPDTDLLFIYGPERCLLGFPAWRLRYAEIVHMGHLKSMKYGSLIKAIHRFSKVRQNYGK